MDTANAYFAGAIDADGFVSVGKKTSHTVRKDGGRSIYYVVKIGLSQTHPDVPTMLHAAFGGYLGFHQPKNSAHRRVHIWQATAGDARKPLLAVLPFLILKKTQAELAVQFLALMEYQNTGRFMGRPLPEDQALQREELYQQITARNAPKNRRVHFS